MMTKEMFIKTIVDFNNSSEAYNISDRIHLEMKYQYCQKLLLAILPSEEDLYMRDTQDFSSLSDPFTDSK